MRRGRDHVVHPAPDDSPERFHNHFRALRARIGRGERWIDLQAGNAHQPVHFGIVEQMVIRFFDRAAPERRRHAILDAHLGLQDALERSRVITTRIAHRGGGRLHHNRLDLAAPWRKAILHRQSQRGLACRLRIITRRRGLVIHRENFERLTGKRRDTRDAIRLVEPCKKPRPSVQRALRRTRPERCQFHRRHRIARGESRMKEHFVATAIRPLVQAAGGVGRETQRADRRVFLQREQSASRDGARQRTGDAGGAKAADHLLIHDGPPDRRADLIAAHRAQDEIAAARLLPLRERQQRGKNHDAQMTYRSRVHVLTHQPMPQRCVRECGFGGRGVYRRSNHAGFAAGRARHANGLATPRQIARLESARKKVQEPDLDLGHHLWRKLIHRQAASGAHHPARKTHLRLISSRCRSRSATLTITACTWWIFAGNFEHFGDQDSAHLTVHVRVHQHHSQPPRRSRSSTTGKRR